MLERHVRIINPLGLHARAAAQLVRRAGRFGSTIMLIRDDTGIAANAESILSVLHLAAAYGAVLRLTVDGIDESEAMMAIERLFLEGFGEI
jgi:phosphotransferase system HPr (HPr) family protein